MSEDLTEIISKNCEKIYLQGAIDAANVIQKSIIMAKEDTGGYPEMSDFVYEILPKIRALDEKRLKELDNE